MKCCLRYEYDTYEALSRELAAPGSVVLTGEGNVSVIAQDLLSQHLTVKTEDNRRIMIHGDDVLSVVHSAEHSGKTRRNKSKKNKSSIPNGRD